MPAFVTPASKLVSLPRAPLSERAGPFYLRFTVLDKPGVMAVISRCLAQYGISIESMIQRGRDPGEPVPIVMLTHDAREGDMAAALDLIAAEGAVTERPCRIRMERF
jgi:homoserine dehydrogenase